MILSASRRTDIPAFYSDWFFNRIHAGYVDVRNPMNIHQVSRIDIGPENIDCIVFWTKDPMPIIDRINELNEYNYYFQFTLNPYNIQIEKNVPSKRNIIDTFAKLSEKIGSDRLIWRYDPILLNKDINIDYHIRYFAELAKRLCNYTNKCVISFIDLYKKTVTNTKDLLIHELDEQEMTSIAKSFSEIAASYDIELQSCSEKIVLSKYRIKHGSCIDKEIIERICGYSIDAKKDKNQRKECGCIESIDIGSYNTCMHHCAYCYANYSKQRVETQHKLHNPNSSMIVGEVTNSDIVTKRNVHSLKTNILF